ncbi:MAG: UbiD family decarboxylase [Chloroflexi bacterium]|nr:UbiD family decarboxylase [Chloroflexota bacterium]
MPNKDLREWMIKAEELGEVQRVEGAHWDIELGAIVDLFQRKTGRPALLFNNIPGYPKNYRILSNTLMSLGRIALTLEMPTETKAVDMVKAWRELWPKLERIPPQEVSDGPVLENINTGDEINLLKFPVPKWHELDGGRYIGTGCLVIMRDPDTGWVNLGTYRVMVHDEKNAALYISPGKHGRIIREKYWKRGQACPVAIACGQDPLLYFLSSVEIPYGWSEYDVAGAIRKEPVEVIKGPATGLPIPASAEIVFEGEVRDDDRLDEGPFGEWTGYYGSGIRPEPVIRVKTVLHRNDPILLGAPPQVPPCDVTFPRGLLRSGLIWDELEKAGVPGIQGVWAHEAGGSRLMLIIAIKQLYGGHSKQAGLIASQCHAGAYANRLVVVVDEDIDPSDTNQVLWAICTRSNPEEDVEIIRKCWSTPLDPMAYPPELRIFNSRMVIDACRPWERLETFPPVATISQELRQQIEAKWAYLFDAPYFRG